MSRASLIKCSCLLLLLCWQSTQALSQDGKKPAYLHADQGTFNQNTGRGIYRGHVKLDQGTTHIDGNKLYTFNDEQHQLQKAKIYGKPAHYRTIPKLHQQPLFAKANLIIYHPKAHYVELIGKAQANQNGDILNGPILFYYIDKQLVVSPNNPHQQTQIIIPPTEAKTS